MKAKLSIEEGQICLVPYEDHLQEMIDYYFDSDGIEMAPVEVEMEVIVEKNSGAWATEEINHIWLELEIMK